MWFTPCLPSHWQQAELTLVREGRTMRFVLHRTAEPAALEAAAQRGAQLLRPGQPLDWTVLASSACFVIPLVEGFEPAPAQAHTAGTETASD